MDMLAQSFFWRHPEIETVILRPCHILGAVNNAPSNYLRLPRPLTVLGFDPMVQVIHEGDVVDAIARVLEPGVRGIFNLRGPGELPLSRILRFLGRDPRPVPAFVADSALKQLWRYHLISFPPPELDHIRFICMVDDQRARGELGYAPRHDIEETLRAVLETAKGRGRVLIELKYYGHDARLEERVAEIVEETGMVAFLGSFGRNHVPGGPNRPSKDYTDTFLGQFVDGAIFNSMESFNGRSLGGVPDDKNQEQIADFIANGGSLGLANVWEPLPALVPDNEFLIQNFLLGDLSWAEAAYTAIPYLSWQQIVIGDPLATVTLVPEPSTAALVMLPAAALLARRRGPAA